MCEIKEGSYIKTEGDLQSFVTSVILRQTSWFSIDDIYHDVLKRLAGTKWHDNPNIRKMCRNAIDTLFNIDSIIWDEHGNYRLLMPLPSASKQ
jgi:hypothetical protein